MQIWFPHPKITHHYRVCGCLWQFQGCTFCGTRGDVLPGKIHLLQLDSRKLRSLLRCHGHSCRDNVFFTVVATIPFSGILCLSHIQQNERLRTRGSQYFHQALHLRLPRVWETQRRHGATWHSLEMFGISKRRAVRNMYPYLSSKYPHVQERYNIHAYCGHLLWVTLWSLLTRYSRSKSDQDRAVWRQDMLPSSKPLDGWFVPWVSFRDVMVSWKGQDIKFQEVWVWSVISRCVHFISSHLLEMLHHWGCFIVTYDTLR